MGGPGSGRRKKLDMLVDPVGVTTEVTAPSAPRTRIQVTGATGEKFDVLTNQEKLYFNRQLKRYSEEFGFTAASDQADLDQLLFQELLDFRWSQWLGRRMDYDNTPLNLVLEDQYRRNKADAQRTIHTIKTRLGMTRASRQADSESIAGYISNLGKRAKEFGVHRNEQVILILTLFNELKSIVGTFDRSNATERAKVGFEEESHIVDWIRDEAIPRYVELDAKFVASSQRYWSGL